MRTLRYLVLGALVVISACAPAAQPAVDSGAEEAAIKATTPALFEAYNAGDVDKVVALYADDAVLMSPNAPVATGRDAIRTFYSNETAGAKAAGVKLVPGAAAAGVVGDLGWASSSYTVTGPTGAAVDSGAYLTVSRKVNGKWLLIRSSYNSSQPAAPAAEKK
jgi:uncharacterized protein (TIGR02246 family)